MVAHNKNYKHTSKAPPAPFPAQPTKPKRRWAEPKDEVSPLCETDLICELADPSNSLEDLCAEMHISLETLSLWMARPDVAERLDLVQTTAMNRARFIGRLTLPTAAQSAANIINAHKLRQQKPTIDSAFNTELHRANENMLKAARFLQRLTAEPAPRRARKSEAPSPKEDGTQGAGEASKGSGDGGTHSSVQLNAESNAGSPPNETANVIQRDQRSQPRARREPKRGPRRNSTSHSKKVRTRTPPRTTRKLPSPPTQSRSNASSTPAPKPSSSIPSHPPGAPPHRARAAENSTAPPRPRSSTPRSASD